MAAHDDLPDLPPISEALAALEEARVEQRDVTKLHRKTKVLADVFAGTLVEAMERRNPE